MQIFISKSRERQRLVKIRARERTLTATHGRDRDAIFKVDRRQVANLNAHPISGGFHDMTYCLWMTHALLLSLVVNLHVLDFFFRTTLPAEATDHHKSRNAADGCKVSDHSFWKTLEFAHKHTARTYIIFCFLAGSTSVCRKWCSRARTGSGRSFIDRTGFGRTSTSRRCSTTCSTNAPRRWTCTWRSCDSLAPLSVLPFTFQRYHLVPL